MNRTIITLILIAQSMSMYAGQGAVAALNFKQVADTEHQMIRATAQKWCTRLCCCRDAHETLLAYFYAAAHVAAAELAYNEVKANIMRRSKKLPTFADDVRKREMKELAYDCAFLKTIVPVKSKHEETLHRIEQHLEGCHELAQSLDTLRDTLFKLMAASLEQRAQELDTLLLQAGEVMADDTIRLIANACRSLAQQPSDIPDDAALMKLNMLNNFLKPLQIKVDEFTATVDALTQAVNVTLVIGRAYFIDAYNILSEQYHAMYNEPSTCRFGCDESVQILPNRL